MSFAKFKDYPFTLENAKKTGLFRMEATFNSDFLETYTDFQISTHGKWKIENPFKLLKSANKNHYPFQFENFKFE